MCVWFAGGGMSGDGFEGGASFLNTGCSLFPWGISTIPQIWSSVRNMGDIYILEENKGDSGPRDF